MSFVGILDRLVDALPQRPRIIPQCHGKSIFSMYRHRRHDSPHDSLFHFVIHIVAKPCSNGQLQRLFNRQGLKDTSRHFGIGRRFHD